MTPVSSSTARRSGKIGDSSPPSHTSAPPAQFPAPEVAIPRRGLAVAFRAPTAHEPAPQIKVAIYFPALRACHQECHQRTPALMVLIHSCYSAPPVAFRCLPLQQALRFGPYGTFQRGLRMHRVPLSSAAALGAGPGRQSASCGSLTTDLLLFRSLKALRMSSPLAGCSRLLREAQAESDVPRRCCGVALQTPAWLYHVH